MFVGNPSSKHRMPPWQQALREELGSNCFSGFGHGSGKGGMQCTYKMGHHPASWAVSKDHIMMAVNQTSLRAPIILFYEEPTKVDTASTLEEEEEQTTFEDQEGPSRGTKRKTTHNPGPRKK